MLFKHLTADLKSQKINMDFREESRQALNSSYALDVMHVMESLIIGDTVGYLQDYDKKYGCYYTKNEDSELSFTNGSSIKISNRKAYFNGKNPDIHCVRHIGNGEVRSTLLNNDVEKASNKTSLYKYSDILSMAQWVRLIEMVNNVLGAEVVSLNNDRELAFDFKTNYTYSIEAQQFIYTIIAECFLTPENYKRLVLLPKLDFLTIRQSLDLIKCLGNISKHELLLTDLKIKPTDVQENDDIVIVSI